MDFAALGLKGFIEATNMQEPPLKVALVGAPGVGKSWLAASIVDTKPDYEVLDLDFDGRASSLAGKTRVTVKTYVDKDPSTPKAMFEFEQDLSILKNAKANGKKVPDGFIIDSFTYARKAIESELIRQQSTLGRQIKVGPKSFSISSGWDIINANRLYMEYVINELSALGDVFGIFHEQDEKDVDKSTKEEKKYTGKITIQPQYLHSITSIFNDCWRLKIRYDDKRVLNTGINNEFVGKCSLRGLDSDEVEPTMLKLLTKHKAALAKATNGTK